MKKDFLQHLKNACAFEEDMVQKIGYVLGLFLAGTDFRQEDIEGIKSILQTLTNDSLGHAQTLQRIIQELETDDK